MFPRCVPFLPDEDPTQAIDRNNHIVMVDVELVFCPL